MNKFSIPYTIVKKSEWNSIKEENAFLTKLVTEQRSVRKQIIKSSAFRIVTACVVVFLIGIIISYIGAMLISKTPRSRRFVYGT